MFVCDATQMPMNIHELLINIYGKMVLPEDFEGIALFFEPLQTGGEGGA